MTGLCSPSGWSHLCCCSALCSLRRESGHIPPCLKLLSDFLMQQGGQAKPLFPYHAFPRHWPLPSLGLASTHLSHSNPQLHRTHLPADLKPVKPGLCLGLPPFLEHFPRPWGLYQNSNLCSNVISLEELPPGEAAPSITLTCFIAFSLLPTLGFLCF